MKSKPSLGPVSGRRRQGKTFLLAALANAWGGFYFGADEAAEAESLRRFADALAQFSGVLVQFTTWEIRHQLSVCRPPNSISTWRPSPRR
ncbi:MAG TPA: hypothetical protein VGA61_16160 [Anaerolineae bacterium]